MVILNSLQDERLVELLRSGAVGVLPTDTVYGLVCSAKHQEAVARLYQLKLRERKPGTVIAASADQLIDLGIPLRYVRAVEHLWPNPISVEIYHKLEYLHQGTGRQAFRVGKNEVVAALLRETGPLLTSSANQPGESPANTLDEARAYFGDSVDFYVDGGDLSGRELSTVVYIVDDAIVVARQGAVKIDDNGQIIEKDSATS